MKNNFYFLSKDKETQIHCIEWVPEGEPIAILQICHGMCEYIDRYDDFAGYLCDRGFYVVGNDHLGHGESVKDDDHYGYFHPSKGNTYLLGDMEEVRKTAAKKYPGIPYFLLGHSMGSFLTRQYMTLAGSELSGVIIMGTGNQPSAMLKVGKTLSAAFAKKNTWFDRNTTMAKIAFAGYNDKIENQRTLMDWLSRDEGIVDKYVEDPWCTFRFTLNGYYNLFYSIEEAQNPRNVANMPKNLPLFIVSGDEDPVGNYVKGVVKVYAFYKNEGIEDVSIKLYEGYRHEILNEIGREIVYEDLEKWMKAHI